MVYYRFFYLFIGILLLIACSRPSTDPPVEQVTADSITFIFEDFPTISSLHEYAGGAKTHFGIPDFLVEYENGAAFLEPFRPLTNGTTNNTTNDTTIFVAVPDSLVRARLKVNAVELFDYLFQKGDSVVFTHNNGYPFARVLNRAAPAYEINLDLELRKSLVKDGKYSDCAKYYYTDLNASSIMETNDAKFKAIFFPLCKANLEKGLIVLDSLKMEDMVSDTYYSYFSDRMNYGLLGLKVENDLLSFTETKNLIEIHSKAAKPKFSAYNHLLDVAVWKFFISNAPLLDIGNGRVKDFRQSFDAIAESEMFPAKEKGQILFRQLSLIAENFSLGDFRSYYDKFASVVHDTALLEKVKSTYYLDFNELRTSAEGLHLATANKQVLTLDSIIALNKGKLIYIDLWASWCGPCRNAMPASIDLRKKYAKEGVVFLYLSTDRVYDRWERRQKKKV